VTILSKRTALPVEEARQGLKILADHLYVIAPNTNLTIGGDVLQSRSRDPAERPHRPVDMLAHIQPVILLILRIELYRLEELAPCMCPTRCMHDLGSTHMIICRVAVTLEYALEVAQEPLGTFPFPTHPKVEHHLCARPTACQR
jgi:hypothetical protein